MRPTNSHGWGRRFNPCTAHHIKPNEISRKAKVLARRLVAYPVGYMTGTGRECASCRGTELTRASSPRSTDRAPVAVKPTMRRPSPILALLTGGAIAAAALTWQPGIHVVDGDTVDHGFWRWRLAGFDAPETGSRARCPEERAAGLAAKVRLAALLRSGTGVLEPVGPVWRADRYGRRLARLTIDGRDVANVMIAEGHARSYDGGRRDSWCPAR